jgi:TPR repeat protein
MQKLLLGLAIILSLVGCGSSSPEAKKAIAAAESGDPDAEFRLAMAYMSDGPSDAIEGIPHDRAKAVEWIKKAAEAGHSQAMFLLGMEYSTSPSERLDFKEALKWFRRAQMAGHAHAAEAIQGLLDSLNIPARPESEKAAIRAAFEDESKTTADLIKAGTAGDAAAARRAAYRLRGGMGVEKDVPRGNELLLAAANKGDLEAMRYLGTAYLFGSDIEQNTTKGLEWLKRGVDQHDNQAMFALGMAYSKGIGVPQDDMEGMKWIKFAAAQGHTGAKLIIAKAEPAVSEQPPQAAQPERASDPKRAAVQNSLAYLDSILGKGKYQVVSSDAVYNDVERENVSYPITVLVEVRYPGPSPTGYVKRTGTFACDAQGRVIQPISLPTL